MMINVLKFSLLLMIFMNLSFSHPTPEESTTAEVTTKSEETTKLEDTTKAELTTTEAELTTTSTTSSPPSSTTPAEITAAKNDEVTSKDENEMKTIVKKISELAQQIIGLMEPMSEHGTATLQNQKENTYFLSFMFKDKKSNETTRYSGGGRKMTVNNNFHGERMMPSQTFVETGNTQKQPAAHNVQLKNDYGSGGK